MFNFLDNRHKSNESMQLVKLAAVVLLFRTFDSPSGEYFKPALANIGGCPRMEMPEFWLHYIAVDGTPRCQYVS